MAGGEASGDKRKKQWKAGGQDNKRHKGALADASTAKGSRGILVTCDRTKERQAVRDALNILNETADKYFPKEAGEGDAEAENEDEEEEDSTAATSVQKMLQDEIAALKADAKKRVTGRFTALDTGVKGVLLIQIKDPALSAVALVGKILEDVDESKEFSSRFINRMIPLEAVGHSSTEDITKVADPMIQEFIAAYKADEATKDTPIEYSVEIKRRNCSRVESREVIDLLAGLVGKDHKVNLTTPNVVLLIEIFRNTFGLSIVTNFHKYRKYNVRSIIEPPVSTKPKESAKKTEEDKEDKEE
ncbi:hypothetical protein Poli38472_001811 [Pythium oligandrum]|uniref:THUMP domain-containing protein n=1 Tax=Pythium oligandrum TaxID=41045 RepID=A0A8K1CU51_PYTOL|nr:hypothetical protein Poli38472_001811 [Pythium oligandrum]|eukprot:TMW69655.1 hypothetical protein Poli38472_001811 [Pythium oligandrum]